MKNLLKLFTLFLLSVGHSFCGQSQTSVPKNTTKAETKNVGPFYSPSKIVRTIIQDKKGNIWMASWEGIFRYDGKFFSNLTSKMTSARFFSALEDRKGNLWFGTIGEGVYYYDGKSFQNFTIKDGLLNNEVTTIYEDKVGNIWFGVSGGTSRYDGKSFQNYIINGDAMNKDWTGQIFYERQASAVNAIIEDKTGKFWFGTRGNTFVYDGKTFAILSNKDGKNFKNVWGLTKDRKGNIWFGAEGLWRYDGSTFTKLSEKGALSILEDKKGNIWTSSTTAMYNKPWRLSRYDVKSLFNEKPTVTEIANKQAIFGILEDYDGNIWFGTGDGVSRYDGKTVMDFKSK